MKSLTAIIVSAAFLVGCGEVPMGPGEIGGPPPPPGGYGAPVFRVRDFAWSTVPGPASIVGVLTYSAGPVRYTCEGEDVILTPQTDWTRRRMMILYGSPASAAIPVDVVRSRIPSAPSGDYVRFVKKTTCDAQNRFTFSNLPDGSWFVITLGKPIGSRSGQVAVMRRVETRGGRHFVSLN